MAIHNLGVHKIAAVREAISTDGARVIYLPPSSHDLNPIELVLSKSKWLLNAFSARIVEALWWICGIDSATPPQRYAVAASGIAAIATR